ncbi:MAG: hypothetical protein ABII71_04875 [Candidatus Micrarchaeota archaeon]
MVKQAYILLAIAALFIGSVAAGTIAASELYLENVPGSCQELDVENGYIWLPGKVSDLFSGKLLILHFALISGNEVTVSGTVGQGGIYGLECGETENADYEIRMSDLNAIELATSTRPVMTFVRLWRQGQIELEPHGEDNGRLLLQEGRLMAQDDEPVPESIRVMFGQLLE